MYDDKLLRTMSGGDAEFYARVREVYELLDARPTDRILDCGCREGVNTMHILTLGRPALAVGVDIELAALRVAKGGQGAHFLMADARHLPFRDRTFTKSLMMEVLEHIPEDAEALRELARVSEDFFVISVPHLGLPRPCFPVNLVKAVLRRLPLSWQKRFAHQVVYDCDGHATNIGHVRHGYTTEEVLAVVEKAGLELLEYRYVYKFFGRRFVDLLYTVKGTRNRLLQTLYFFLLRLDRRVKSHGLCIVLKVKAGGAAPSS